MSAVDKALKVLVYTFTMVTAVLGIYTAIKLLELDPVQELLAVLICTLVASLITIALKLGRVEGRLEK